MLDSAAKAEFDKQHRVTQIVFLAMMASVLLYLVVGVVLRTSGGRGEGAGADGALVYVFYGLAAGLIALILLIRRRLIPSTKAFQNSQSSLSELLVKYRTGYIVALALGESVGVLGLVLSLLSGSLTHLFRFCVVSIVLVVTAYPRKITRDRNTMKVLVVGSGGREHALVWKILQSRRVSRVYCEPGNGGTAREAGLPPHGFSRIEDLADFARDEGIDLTVVGPEVPLTQGIVDFFEKQKLPILGPNLAAARLEGSKLFAKQFMQRNNIPTSPYFKTASSEEARAILKDWCFGYPLVIKADGLAAGKGVVIAGDPREAQLAIRQMLEDRALGAAGDQILIEQYLVGEEVSFLVFTDGIHVLPMVPSQDHKRVFDGDCGPNTGGMGAYSTDWLLSPDLYRQVMDRIVYPTVLGMAAEGTPYRGILYFGLMLTADGPPVLEFNVRMGDPETQPVLFRMKSDIMDVFEGILEKKLDQVPIEWSPGCSICVVLASGGYPRVYEKGKPISGISEAENLSGIKVFHAGTGLNGNQLVTTGGRVLGVTAYAEDLRSAIGLVYQAVERIHFDKIHFRRDIGAKGLRKIKG